MKIWSGIARDEVRAQPRRGHGLPGHRGRRQARARRLRHDRAPEGRRAGRGGLQRQGDAVVRRLRSRAHRLQGQGRRARRSCARSRRAEPLANVEIRLVARNNDVLATKSTDAAGHVAFDPGLARGEGGNAPGLIVASTGEDYGFLDLGSSAFDLTDRGVKGRVAPGAVDAFVFTERGVYRSGETVFVTALLRDAKGAAISGLPLTLVAKRPDGVEYRRAPGRGPGSRRTRLLAAAPPRRHARHLARQRLHRPEGRARRRGELPRRGLRPGAARGDAFAEDACACAPASRPRSRSRRAISTARPGAELDVSGEVVVQAAATPGIKGLEGFTVGLEDETVEAATAEIEEHGTTDAQGRVVMSRAGAEARGAAADSRPRSRCASARRAAAPSSAASRCRSCRRVRSIGVRKNFGGDLAEGATATFDVVLVAPDGTRQARQGVAWNLYKVERRYQWFNSDGRWGFEPVKSTRRVADGRIDVSAAEPARIATPVEWGSYRLDVRVDGVESAQTSVSFTVGWSRRPDRRHARPPRHDARQGELRLGRRDPAPASRRALPARRPSRSSATRCTTSRSSTSPPTARR